jgi:hypothetical protein
VCSSGRAHWKPWVPFPALCAWVVVWGEEGDARRGEVGRGDGEEKTHLVTSPTPRPSFPRHRSPVM